MAKYQRRKTARPPENPSFEWEVLYYDFTSKKYKIKNKVSGETRSLSKEDYIELANKQREGKR